MGPGGAGDAVGTDRAGAPVPAVPAPLRVGPDGRPEGLPASWQDWVTAALVRGEEATLKYLRKEGGQVRLDPANAAYDPQYYRADEVEVQGKLAGLLRRYGHPMTLERMQRLETAVEQPQRPRLHLVHG